MCLHISFVRQIIANIPTRKQRTRSCPPPPPNSCRPALWVGDGGGYMVIICIQPHMRLHTPNIRPQNPPSHETIAASKHTETAQRSRVRIRGTNPLPRIRCFGLYVLWFYVLCASVHVLCTRATVTTCTILISCAPHYQHTDVHAHLYTIYTQSVFVRAVRRAHVEITPLPFRLYSIL